MLSDYQRAFVMHWKSLDFSNWNESDVREEFIAPLLRILGYSKGTVNSIAREHHVKLAQPYHRVGRDKIIIDYLPSIKLRNFWIIEAKPGNVTPMDFGDLLQAHLYAIHPEVQVPYIVLCNGHEVRIYDTYQVSSWDDALCISSKYDAEETFSHLEEILSASSLLAFHRARTLANVEMVFKNEIDEREFLAFRSEVNDTLLRLESQVKANAKDFQAKSFRENERRYLDHLSGIDLEELIAHMDIPTNTGPQPSNEVIVRLRGGSGSERKAIVDRLAMTFRGRPHTILRVHALSILCEALSICPDLTGDIYFSTVPELVNELAIGNITYSVDTPLHNALWHYDNICLRVAKKITMKKNLELLALYVQDLRRTMAAEDLLSENPNLELLAVQISGLAAEALWRIAVSSDADTIWQVYWVLEDFEKVVDRLPDRKNPEYGGDFLWLEHYGIDYDMLLFGSWAILSERCSAAEAPLVSAQIKDLAKLPREAVVQRLPKPRVRPTRWRPTQSVLEQVLRVLIDA